MKLPLEQFAGWTGYPSTGVDGAAWVGLIYDKPAAVGLRAGSFHEEGKARKRRQTYDVRPRRQEFFFGLSR
jgi:hypothetical protein